MGRPGRFVGVGIDVYEGHDPLAHAVAEVKAVAEVLAEEFAGEPLLDPDQRQVTEYFETVLLTASIDTLAGVDPTSPDPADAEAYGLLHLAAALNAVSHVQSAPHGTLRGWSLGCRYMWCRSAKQATTEAPSASTAATPRARDTRR